MIKITLTKEQYDWLIRFINKEWNEEVDYQWCNKYSDTSYLEEVLDVYIALLGKPDGFIHAYCIEDDIKSKLKDIKELKESNEIY